MSKEKIIDKKVEIVWVDSTMRNDWVEIEKARDEVEPDSMECRSVGYVFHEDDEKIVLVGHQASGRTNKDLANVADAMSIPKVAITRITTLVLGKVKTNG